MRRSVALLLVAVIGLVLANDSHKHHSKHSHIQSGEHDRETEKRSEQHKRPVDFAPEYRPQREYYYQYDTQISTGLNDQQQNAVQRMRAQLRLAFVDEKTAVAQLKDWQSARLNEEVHQPVTKMMQFESLRSTEIPKRHLDLLEKPFEIKYEKGKVVEVVFDKEDKTWSENMKRAAINPFQIQMDVEERNAMTYRVNETTIEGECQSVYTIIPEIKCNSVRATGSRHLEVEDKGQCAQVTKSVNFDMCKQRPDLRYNHYRGERMDTNSAIFKEQRAVEQSTIYQCELKKDEGKYLLRFARIISHQTVHLTDKTAMMGVSVTETKLSGIKRSSSNTPEVAHRKAPASLMHSLEFDEMMERFILDGNEEYIREQPYLTERNIPDVVVNIGKKLAHSFIGNPQDEWSMDTDTAAHQFTNLVKILRHATNEDLKKAEERLFEKDEDISSAQQKTTMESLYTDALALAGTKVTIQRLLEKVKKLDENEAASTLQKLARNIQIVGKDSLDSIWNLCKQAQQGTTIQHACVLSWSRMANTMCSRNEKSEWGKKIGDVWTQDKQKDKDEERKPRCSEALKTELVQRVKTLYEEASGDDIQQRILALKAYGNMGIDASIQHLEMLINDRSLPRLERIIAVDALRQMVTQIPNKIRRMLMSVFVDKKEFPEMRMNAIHLILKAQPDQPTISQIGMETLRESNMNVRTFVVSELKNAAVAMRKMNPKSAQQMLNTAQLFKLTSIEQMEQMRRSGSRYVTSNIGEYLIASFASLYSNDSNLPKELMLQLDASFREHFIPVYYQIGLHQQDIEQLISKLFDRVGSKSIDEILVRGKRSTLRDFYSEPVQTMKQMFERIVARRSSKAESLLMLYQREKQMDTWFVLINEKHLPDPLKQLFSDGQIDLAALETRGNRQLKSIDANFVFETKVKVPTIFGVPIIATCQLTKISALYGSVSTELQGQGKYISSGRISLKNVPKVSLKMMQKLEAFSPLFTVGVQMVHNMDAQIPLTLEASFSSQEGLVVDLKLPEQKDRTYKLLHMSSHPSTLYREFPQKSRVVIEPEEKTLFLPKLQDFFVNVDKQVRCPMTQFKLDIRGHLHKSGEGLYLGENVIEINGHITEETAKILRLQAHLDSKPTHGQTIEIQRLMRLFDPKRQEDNVKPQEVKMLQEYLQRQNVQVNSLSELDVKLMALNGKNEQPTEQIEVLAKTLCDREKKMCSEEVHIQAKGTRITNNEWSAHIMMNMARPMITGLHGSIRSEHVLVHAEAQFGGRDNKDILTFCAYGRPTKGQIMQWNEVMNMQSASRQSKNFDSMEDEEYDRMVMKQMPSKLNAKHFTVLTEYQLSPYTMKYIRPYVEYTVMSSKPHPILSLFAAFDIQESGELENLHGTFKSDLVVEGANRITFQVNKMRTSKQLPSWSDTGFMMKEDGHYNFDMDDHSWKSSETDSSSEKENGVPSRRSYGQRQAMSRFGREDPFSYDMAQCILDSSNNVESFDGKKYKILLSTCYTLLSKDCGSSSSSKYAVLVKKLNEHKTGLKVKLLINQGEPAHSRQFVLYMKNNDMVIEMNGVQLREEEYAQNGIHKIKETRHPTYVLQCSVTKMELRFDGRRVLISIGHDYINRQCGVCGHYNLDSEDVLRMEDNTLASSLKDFHSSYLYREDGDPECTAEAKKKFEDVKEEEYHKKSKFSGSESEESSDELINDMEKKNQRMKQVPVESKEKEERKKKKQKKTESSWDSNEFDREFKKIDPIPMTKISEEHDMVCFSLKPQMECPPGSYALVEDAWTQRSSSSEDSHTDPEVEFVCMSRNQSKARKILKQLRRGEHVISDLETMQPNKRIPVKQAKRCSKSKRMPADN